MIQKKKKKSFEKKKIFLIFKILNLVKKNLIEFNYLLFLSIFTFIGFFFLLKNLNLFFK
jgi:hypothetical protein